MCVSRSRSRSRDVGGRISHPDVAHTAQEPLALLMHNGEDSKLQGRRTPGGLLVNDRALVRKSMCAYMYRSLSCIKSARRPESSYITPCSSKNVSPKRAVSKVSETTDFEYLVSIRHKAVPHHVHGSCPPTPAERSVNPGRRTRSLLY